MAGGRWVQAQVGDYPNKPLKYLIFCGLADPIFGPLAGLNQPMSACR